MTAEMFNPLTAEQIEDMPRISGEFNKLIQKQKIALLDKVMYNFLRHVPDEKECDDFRFDFADGTEWVLYQGYRIGRMDMEPNEAGIKITFTPIVQ